MTRCRQASVFTTAALVLGLLAGIISLAPIVDLGRAAHHRTRTIRFARVDDADPAHAHASLAQSAFRTADFAPSDAISSGGDSDPSGFQVPAGFHSQGELASPVLSGFAAVHSESDLLRRMLRSLTLAYRGPPLLA